MPKGQYIIDDSRGNGRADTSFRACVIALLVFVLFCVTIIIIMLVVKREPGRGGSGGDGGTSALSGEKTHTTTVRPSGKADTKSSPEDDHEKMPMASGGSTTSLPEHPSATSTKPSVVPDHRSDTEGKSDASVTTSKTTDYTSTAATKPSVVPDHRSDTEGKSDASGTTSKTTDYTSTAATKPSVVPDPRSDTEGKSDASVTTSKTTDYPSTTSTDPSPILKDGDEKKTGSSDHADPTPVPLAPTTSTPEVTCMTPECKRLAAGVLYTMDMEADRCKHFYEYACGGLRRNRYHLEPDYAEEAFLRIQDQVNKINATSTESLKKFKTLEESCKNYDPDTDMEQWKGRVWKDINDLGAFITDGSVSTPNLTHLFLGLLQRDRPFIVDITLDINDQEPTKFALKIYSAEMAHEKMDSEKSEIMDCQSQAVMKQKNLNDIYQDTLTCLGSGDGRKKKMEIAKMALRKLSLNSSLEEEEKLNKILQDYETFLNLNHAALSGKRIKLLKELQTRKRELEPLEKLNNLFENLKVDWRGIIETLINRPMNESEKVQLYSKDYFTEINDKFNSRLRELHNGLLVSLAAARFRQLALEQQRWRRAQDPLHCTRAAAQLLPDVAAALYLRSFDAALREQLLQAAEDQHTEILGTLMDELYRADRLNVDLAHSLVEKISHNQLANVSEALDLMDTDKLNKELKEISFNDTDFVGTTITLMKRNRNRLFKRIDEDPINHIWTHFIPPYATEAISIYSLNKIAVPLGALQKPFFDPKYPSLIQMAGLGFTVAHEMIHHIDLVGVHVKLKLKKPEEETNVILGYRSELPEYSPVKKSVTIEYMNMTDAEKYISLSFHFSDDERELKRNEYLSDWLGMKIIYKTYKARAKKPSAAKLENLPFLPLTMDQTFFVYLAQKYCTKADYSSMIIGFFESADFPPETKVENMMVNSDFYSTFGCPGDTSDFPFPYQEAVDTFSLGA